MINEVILKHILILLVTSYDYKETLLFSIFALSHLIHQFLFLMLSTAVPTFNLIKRLLF